jgi:hypothetical protein
VRRRRWRSGDDRAAAASFATAISGLREHGTPYHLAQGLLDYAQYLLHRAEGGVAEVDEARDIATSLRCQPLLDRAARITPAQADEVTALR